MRTSVDTNVLSAIWGAEAGAYALAHLLIKLQADGPIVICAPVWVELAARPGMDVATLDTMLTEARVEIDFDLPRPVWAAASQAYAAYILRRRQSGGSPPRQRLADFVIGAHAATKTGRLVSGDARFFREVFPGLEVIVPAATDVRHENLRSNPK